MRSRIWKRAFVFVVLSLHATIGRVSAQTPDTLDAAPRAIIHSSQYYSALAVHRDISYAMIPLFGVQYALGRELIKGGAPTWVRTTHVVGFHLLGAMAIVNTATGIVNLVSTRKEKPDRVRRIIHTTLMLAGDAGFAYTASVAHDAAKQGADAKRRHEHAAILSMSLTTAGAVVMWLR